MPNDDAEALRIATFEAERWGREGWQRGRDAHVSGLKGQAAGLTTKRVATYQWALKMVEKVEQAYEALDLDKGDAVGGTILAKQLADQGVLTRRGVKPTSLSDRGKAFADDLIHKTDAAMIDEAVMECRTRMTARCLSADFAAKALDDLENEYVEIIADFMALGRRLRNLEPIARSELLKRAKDEAIVVAQRQRRDKPQVTMAARERYWRDRPAPIRKIFAPA